MFCIIDPLNILRPNNPKALVKAISRTSSQSTFCIHQINLKIRINPGEFELTVSASTADTILDLKHSILELSSQQVSWETYINFTYEKFSRFCYWNVKDPP